MYFTLVVTIKFVLLLSILIFSGKTYSKEDTIKEYISGCLNENKDRSSYIDQTFDGVTITPNFNKNTFNIDMKIHFRIESFVGDFIKLIPIVEDSMNEAIITSEKFYHKYGLNLNIIASYDLTQDYMPTPVPKGAKLVYLRPFRGSTMNVLRWGLNSTWDVERRAKIYVHELTHFFDIPDEYKKDHGINSVATMEEDSFMNKWDHQEATMYLRHVTAILKNSCNIHN